MSKEEFNKIWEDTTREGILNQFYYDYMYMKKLKEDIKKAIEYIENNTYSSACTLKTTLHLQDDDLYDLLEILKGEENDR